MNVQVALELKSLHDPESGQLSVPTQDIYEPVMLVTLDGAESVPTSVQVLSNSAAKARHPAKEESMAKSAVFAALVMANAVNTNI